ncbi:MAG: hypothetical protein ACD_36C00189G0003 [uncultured bacterium]|uniref:Uncharacterized protein n=1 Tax=Candidatus Gottesmanbacteria bacterium RIFCSPLOWO2_01_FULL_43_11b TaxID=1798392 RepID=A0A1F6AHL2_9BACT|nr:MAG: hypothetical protein ACD_36C00189G0003 [uncultured bacterium]OGG23747.1 MAG: hypothetical protein A3A79_00880 [Candidatus Gottesmanbacteria bacterium RIFCSPLOWO2_01_FULL_43_11b]
MKRSWFAHNSLYVFLFALFILTAALDIVNFDSFVYKTICGFLAPLTNSPCTDFYDIPIWTVYLSLAIVLAVTHVHGEIKISNKHLSSHKH